MSLLFFLLILGPLTTETLLTCLRGPGGCKQIFPTIYSSVKRSSSLKLTVFGRGLCPKWVLLGSGPVPAISVGSSRRTSFSSKQDTFLSVVSGFGTRDPDSRGRKKVSSSRTPDAGLFAGDTVGRHTVVDTWAVARPVSQYRLCPVSRVSRVHVNPWDQGREYEGQWSVYGKIRTGSAGVEQGRRQSVSLCYSSSVYSGFGERLRRKIF